MSWTRGALAGGAAALLVAASACGSSDEASKSPDQILSDVRAALTQVHSFHFTGAITSSSGSTTAAGDVSLPGKLHLTLTQSDATAEVIYISGKSYLKANKAFWDRNGGGQAGSLLADKWVIVPNSAGGLNELTDITDPSKIGDCVVGGPHGKLTSAGTDSVNGQSAVVVADDGNAPGDAPGKLWVASSGTAYPLRTQQTGPQKPGGTPHACSSGSSTSGQVGSNLYYSAFNSSVTIQAPQGAVDLSNLSG